MELLFASLLCCCCAAVAFAADVIPEYIKPCKRTDPQLDKCVERGVLHLDGYLIKGIDDLGVPSLEPLVVPKIQVENGVGRIRVKAAFSNMTIHGAGNHTITNIRSNIKDYRIDFGLKLPKITATGRYEVSGTVLVAHIRSKGEFWASFDDILGVARLNGQEVEVGGVKHLKVDKVLIDFKIGKARFKVKDRSSNSRIIGEAINNFLNQNWREVIEEMKHTAGSAIGKYFKNILNKALGKIPLKVILTED